MASTDDVYVKQDSLWAEDLTNVYDDSSLSLNSLVLDSANDPVVKYYICRSDGGGATITGRPDDTDKNAFLLKVQKVRYISTTDYIIKQFYMDTNTSKIWYRTAVMSTSGISWRAWNSLYTTEFKPTASEIGAAASSHTHKYAGSSSAGGSANSAVKLQTARTINGVAFDGTKNISTYVIAGKKSGTTLGSCATAEGNGTVASAADSHAEGLFTTASGNYSHAEGSNTVASGASSHAEGKNTKASATESHAEGISTEASGDYSHAEGSNTVASGDCSHAEGKYAVASGANSHAEGSNTVASGASSHASGYATTAQSYQLVSGKYNKTSSGPSSMGSNNGSLFIIGRGTGSSTTSNAFRVSTIGVVYGSGAYNSSGADYAEYFEWKDKNLNKEDRVGLFVTLDGNYIRIANKEDDYILGVVSGNPSVIGDSYFGDNWHGMYKTDIYGRMITETVHVDQYTDEKTGKVVEEHDEVRTILNEEYDPELEYIAREDRSEWDAIGLLGKLIVVDDGTCQINGYCKVSNNGIATKSENGYRVIQRLDDNHIKIIFR